MKKTSDETYILAYAYGCGYIDLPIDNEFIIDEVTKQREFWNRLLDIQLSIDNEIKSQMVKDVPELKKTYKKIEILSQKMDRLCDDRRTIRREVKKLTATPELDEQIKAIAKERYEVKKTAWDLEKKWRKKNIKAKKEDRNKFLDNIKDKRNSLFKEARQNSGLYWGNYNRVMQDFMTALAYTRKKGRSLHKIEPDESGILTLQVQKTETGLGASFEELVDGKFSPFFIAPVDPIAYTLGSRPRSRACQTRFDFRIDKDNNIFSSFVWLHRPIPDDCRIKSIQLVWKRSGTKLNTKLIFSCAFPKIPIKHPSKKKVGINFGWRLVEDQLLVATCVDSDGKVDRIYLSDTWMRRMDYVDVLTSKLDIRLASIAESIQKSRLPDSIKELVNYWNPKVPVKTLDVEAIKEALEDYFSRKRYSKNALYDELILWLEWDDRKRNERDNLRVKVLRNRKEIYRIIAKQMADKYSVLCLGDLDLARLARLKGISGVNNQRVRANLHGLKDSLVHAANKAGAETILVSDNYTQIHNDCSEKITSKNQANVLLHCDHCDVDFDQDINAALNLLACIL